MWRVASLFAQSKCTSCSFLLNRWLPLDCIQMNACLSVLWMLFPKLPRASDYKHCLLFFPSIRTPSLYTFCYFYCQILLSCFFLQNLLGNRHDTMVPCWESYPPKGALPEHERVLFSWGVLSNSANTSNIEKCLSSMLSSNISPLTESEKILSFIFLFSIHK